jgi:hypothetical protein
MNKYEMKSETSVITPRTIPSECKEKGRDGVNQNAPRMLHYGRQACALPAKTLTPSGALQNKICDVDKKKSSSWNADIISQRR